MYFPVLDMLVLVLSYCLFIFLYSWLQFCFDPWEIVGESRVDTRNANTAYLGTKTHNAHLEPGQIGTTVDGQWSTRVPITAVLA